MSPPASRIQQVKAGARRLPRRRRSQRGTVQHMMKMPDVRAAKAGAKPRHSKVRERNESMRRGVRVLDYETHLERAQQSSSTRHRIICICSSVAQNCNCCADQPWRAWDRNQSQAQQPDHKARVLNSEFDTQAAHAPNRRVD
eukprot:631819-Prymnesium_polylepis.1